MPSPPGLHYRRTALWRVGLGLHRVERQSGPTALARRALAQMDVAAIRPIGRVAQAASQDVDRLAIIRSGQSCRTDVLLLVAIGEPNAGRSLILHLHARLS